MEYPKIETLFDRDESFVVDTTKLRLPEFGLVSKWLVTEKINGTNVRVHYWSWRGGDGERHDKVEFGGRTDDAQFPTFLLTRLDELFPAEKLRVAFPPKDDEQMDVWLFGEGYGPKIQNGGNYRTKDQGVSFRLFDVRVGMWWLNWTNVENVADKLGIDTVPVLGKDSLLTVIDQVRGEYESVVSFAESEQQFIAEGVVARTDPLLFTRKGERLMWKLKARDFRTGKRRG